MSACFVIGLIQGRQLARPQIRLIPSLRLSRTYPTAWTPNSAPSQLPNSIKPFHGTGAPPSPQCQHPPPPHPPPFPPQERYHHRHHLTPATYPGATPASPRSRLPHSLPMHHRRPPRLPFQRFRDGSRGDITGVTVLGLVGRALLLGLGFLLVASVFEVDS